MQQSCKKGCNNCKQTIMLKNSCRKKLLREKRKKGLKNIGIEFQTGMWENVKEVHERASKKSAKGDQESVKEECKRASCKRELHRDKTVVTLSTIMIPKPPTAIRTKYVSISC